MQLFPGTKFCLSGSSAWTSLQGWLHKTIIPSFFMARCPGLQPSNFLLDEECNQTAPLMFLWWCPLIPFPIHTANTPGVIVAIWHTGLINNQDVQKRRARWWVSAASFVRKHLIISDTTHTALLKHWSEAWKKKIILFSSTAMSHLYGCTPKRNGKYIAHNFAFLL